ncbi:hypothetical protein FOZ60_007953 [Perkinsus olseni]|uniref:Uncharacterized protein n=1 Tax=Perkinsus olseni TaxID=32597 RepID=A0A7J6NKK7_PEROL|nr:hypothetical protein FOZ60_007953 [Perkinsus olseni]
MIKPDGSPASSSASSGSTGSPIGPLRVTRKSTAAEVLQALKQLTFLGSITVDSSFADVDGEMLLQMGSPTALKELVTTARQLRPPTPQPPGDGAEPTPDADLGKILTQLLNADTSKAEKGWDQRLATAVQNLQESFGCPSGDLLPPSDVLKELFKAKEDGKPGTIPFLPLRRFTPISMTGMTLPDSYASTVSTRGMCLATAYTLAGFWKPADGANYCNALTKLAAQHSPTLSAKYDALVREKWAVKSVTNSDFDISHETSTLDLEAMVLLQNDASKAGRSQRSTANYCNNFNKGPAPTLTVMRRPRITDSHIYYAEGERTTGTLVQTHRPSQADGPPLRRPLEPSLTKIIKEANAIGDSKALNDYRTERLRFWERRSTSPEIEALRAELLRDADEATQHRLRKVNLPLFSEMLTTIGHCDTALPHDLCDGMRITGTLTTNGLYEPKDADPPVDKEAALDSASQQRAELGHYDGNSDHELDEALWQQALAETTTNRLRGPFTEQQLNHNHNGRWLYSPRFPKRESDKIRGIDDMKASSVNLLTSVPELIHLDNLDNLIAALQLCKEHDSQHKLRRHYVIAKGDHRQAYRQVAVHGDDYDVLYVRLRNPNTGTWNFFQHLTLPALVAIMRAEFKCLAFSYVDDYFFLCDKGQAALCYQIFIRLNELLGFEVKREKSSSPPPKASF